jgi:phosphatidylinositol glycan class O
VCAVATHILQGSDVLITVAAGTALPGHAFTATGHAPRFSSLAYGAGFVGLDSFIPAPAGALLALNTYGPGMLLVLAPLVAALPPALGAVASDGVARRAALLLHVPPALVAVATCAFVAFARRHLLVWAVFAPKFVFDGVSLAFTIVVSCVHA